MKELELFIKTVIDGMKMTAKGIETLAEKLDTISKSHFDEKGKAKPERKAPRKPAKKTPSKKAATKKPFSQGSR